MSKKDTTEQQITDGSTYSYDCISTVLDSLDALVYVTDMDTYEVIYLNKFGLEAWGSPEGKRCYQLLQINQNSPCDFCSNDKLLDENGVPTGVYIWEFKNTVNQRWYQCRDQAIHWIDGRVVRIEIAIDITDRKKMEAELKAAKLAAEKLADIDPLTGCLNRRAFFNRAGNLVVLAKRQQTPLNLVMMDLDRFKDINDHYGHEAGDIVLSNVVELVLGTIDETDIFARFGGEEFIFLLPNTDQKESIQQMERLRVRLSELMIPVENHTINLTASFGLCSFGPQSDLDDVIRLADEALYKAKEAGRNRLEVAGAAGPQNFPLLG